MHQFVQQKRVDMQRAHEAASFHLQAAQQRRNALYNSKLHGPRYKPGDNVWLHSSVTPKGLIESQTFIVVERSIHDCTVSERHNI